MKQKQGLPPDPELFRRAAEMGPGFRGVRLQPSLSERKELALKFDSANEPIPEYLFAETQWVDRSAKLFEAGEYPDKGVVVSQEHLQCLANEFALPVPILIEHAESPLEIGFLTAVEARGNELFGTLSLTAEANSLVEKSDARSLSLGLSPDLKEIREVSLVRHPRVVSARLFSGGVLFQATLQGGHSSHFDSGAVIERLVREGRLIPAQVPLAAALLKQERAVQFEGSQTTVRDLLISLFELQPRGAHFSGSLQLPQNPPQGLMPEEAEFYRKHFPGISIDEIAKHKGK